MGAAAAVLAFGFDASFQFGDFVVRWQTIGLAVAVFAGIAWSALIAGRTPVFEAAVQEPQGEASRYRKLLIGCSSLITKVDASGVSYPEIPFRM